MLADNMVANTLVLLLCTFLVLPSTNIAFPEYLPASQSNIITDRDTLVEKYFNLGLNYAEILAFLLTYHAIKLSLRQLKRILRAKNLRRRKTYMQ